jgi:hypothetical protein
VELEASIDPDTIIVRWTAPASENGDAVTGYKVYVDDGFGGPFAMVFDGHLYPSTYQYTISQGLVCGRRYFVQVTALNVAGEGPYTEAAIWLGMPPSEPLSLYLV